MKKSSFRIRSGRIIYLILSSCLTLCTLIQIYLAGMAIFLNPTHWTKHTIFGHLFLSMLPLFMLIFAVIGSLPRWAYWQILDLFSLVFLIYFTANISFVLPWMSPMHPVIAFFLFALSGSSMLKTWKLFREEKQREGKNRERQPSDSNNE